ncbi:oxidoreductase [Gluconacetobacter liquefaciens]|uniref:Oxidoreductase n=1 Tax=Gluconacetobacter liquefaciens TaxID=89584 RepID=A0A370GAL7_GLULI|nr:FAD-dependent monooxygenase [Gluconacetobacter liquefaciens]MBB2185308.1 oxidoreductase [Gluconacetobacter liquefaciens]RDI40747.1 2-polyprenyl-6-methoxyphenol hydroxylase-like FAD-dependent oxidoreductase [Gluconacetobacter liquefaciens]GBR03207.1 FAD-binding monooxygenase [Gluconacetobacter liquefaciens NRIC 0522]GEB37746.1 oxidoreductase [Gluconacetobacter liquefaciens]
MTQRALIVGLGIGGMSAAIALKRHGWTPVIIERAPERRKGGYFIGLRDEGKNAAAALGVLDVMEKRTPEHIQFWDVRKDGTRRRIADLTQETNAPIALLRGDIEEALWHGLEDKIEVRFGTVPVVIVNGVTQAKVTFRNDDGQETTETYDLVIGADGVRSTVRKLVFGPDKAFFHSIGTMLCAFPLARPVIGFKAGDGLMVADVKRTLTVFPLEDRPSTALFSYRTKNPEKASKQNPLPTLRRIFADLDGDGIISRALEDLASTDDFLFDSVQMVKMPRWSQGRVLLLGDSAWCLTLYSGMGASAGMIGGQVLGEALAACPHDIAAALETFEARMRPFIRKHQRFIALRSQLFVPSNRAALWGRRVLWQILLRSRKYLSRKST